MTAASGSGYAAMERTGKKNGILFIDEINCVSETLAPTMLQFLQCKTFGNQAVPGGWVIVAAGNPPEYNKSVREFDLVTLDRVRRIDIEPKLSVWQDYARAHRLHPAVTAYLELRPQHFYKIENDVDGVQFVTARGWEDLSAYLQAADRLALPVDEGVIGQYLRHPEVARDFSRPTGCSTASTTRITASRIFCRASPMTPSLHGRWTRALTSASVWSACCWRA